MEVLSNILATPSSDVASPSPLVVPSVEAEGSAAAFSRSVASSPAKPEASPQSASNRRQPQSKPDFALRAEGSRVFIACEDKHPSCFADSVYGPAIELSEVYNWSDDLQKGRSTCFFIDDMASTKYTYAFKV